MTTSDATLFCAKWLPAWTANQPQTLLSFYTSDAFYLDPARPGGLRGHDQLLTYFTKLLAKNPEWVWKAKEVISTEKGFILKWVATFPGDDQSVTIEGLDIVEVQDGKITRN